MMAQALFMRGTLDKLKIVPEYYHIAEFKTAPKYVYREKIYSRAHAKKWKACCTASTASI